MKIIRQLDVMDCGPSCLMMIAQFYGKKLSLAHIRYLSDKGQQGVTLLGINRTAQELGLKTLPLRLDVDTFVKEAQLPCIVHWQEKHFVVVYKIKNNCIYVADPAKGKVKLTREDFINNWSQNGSDGIALFVQPTEKFYQQESDTEHSKNGLVKLVRYIGRFKKFVLQLGLGALLGSLLNLIFPFLTQALVDHGIGNRDIGFVYAILIAQLMLFFSRTSVEFIRGWILVHMGTRINVTVVSEFLLKMMRLPLSFFGRRNLGDVLQRITDHHKIEEFLTSHSINIVFAMLNLLIFSLIMAIYSSIIFVIFFVGSLLSIGWVTLFLNKRKVLDYQQFNQMSANQNNIVQLVQGMAEIKLNDCSASRRWEWEQIQAKLFKTRLNALAVEQYQQGGTLFINEGKNILITFVAANLVIQGQLSLGMMMAITYILGQMNAPIEQLLQFIRQAQDAKISMERLGEFQSMPEEKEAQGVQLIEQVPIGDVQFKNFSFKYSRHDKHYTLENLNFSLPHRKTTAIVGASGSGKTTLLKLLLKFYSTYEGNISLAGQDLSYICPDAWRKRCGVVMQDGFIFSDTVTKNIALGNEQPDMQRIIHAAKTANLHDEIEKLPQGYFTKIGAEGVGLSGGQTQRVLIARAVYKNPEFIFFDEATSALDANNEKIIQENLKCFFKDKTVVVIAHRLSTVKQADQIIVLDKGKIVEQGDHISLTQNRAYYYDLVKNQLELGN
ncbi:MAG: peptidase domain-containing ABC transporter [Alteromonadaceae bacterium]|nr:peptidase domain-containing ABC transporter [Alteromonadaceae bacterium]